MGKIKLKSIKVFEQDEKIFTSNGLGIVHPTSCIIKRNLSEMTYSLELECIIDEQNKWKLFEVGRIIVAKNQPFRIGIVEHNPVDRTMKVYAEHIFFDLQNNFIEDTNIVDKNGNMAITQLLSHTVEPHNFIGTSDITEVSSFRCVRKQVLTALLGEQDASFINRWGGELDIDGLTFKINKQIGEDKGYKIKYGKNLTGLNYKTNMNLNTMVTKLRPIGFDGISLDEKYVISSHINDYPMPIIREIKYENVKWKGSPNFESREDDDSFIYDNLSDAQDKLRELAQKEFENGIDLLDVTLDVNFIELSKTEEYKDYKILETIELGDTVTLEYAPLGIYTKQRCVEYELDVLTDRYNSIVLGDCEPNFFNETNKVIGAVADAVISGKLNINGGISDNKIQEIISNMTEIMTNYLSGYVVITNNEILIMDTDDKETAQNVWRFNSGGIAHSSTGYNGTYTVGMTMDGHINGRIISANTIMGESMVANTVTARELAVELNKKIEDSQTKEQVEQIFTVGEGKLKSFISETYETKSEVTQKIDDLSEVINDKQTVLSTNIFNELNLINSQLVDFGNTNMITPQLKLSLKNMFNNAIVTNDKLNSLYDVIGSLDAESFKDDKDTSFVNLENQMNLLFSNITETTIKPISEIYDLFNDFYIKASDLEKVLNHLAQEKINYTYSNLELLKESLDITFGRIDTIEGHVEEINKHFTFNLDGLTIYSTDNTSASNVSLNLDNDQMSFKDGDSVVAYISSNKLNIENAEVKNEFIIGKFSWKPSPKGGLMLVKRGDS